MTSTLHATTINVSVMQQTIQNGFRLGNPPRERLLENDCLTGMIKLASIARQRFGAFGTQSSRNDAPATCNASHKGDNAPQCA
jgi:hypothetical protein